MMMPPKPGRFVAHTNHPLENDDVDEQQRDQLSNGSREDTKSTAAVRPRGWDSSTRLSRMEEYLVAELPPLRGNLAALVEKTKDALVRAVAFSPPSELRTFGLAVMICDAAQPRLECTKNEFEPFVLHTFSEVK